MSSDKQYFNLNNNHRNDILEYSNHAQETQGAHWMTAFLASILICLSSIICLVIGWIVYSRWKNGWLLSFAIIATLTFLISLFFIFWSFTNNKKRKNDAEYHPPAVTEVAVWLLALLLLLFFITAGFAFFLYMNFHSDFMAEKSHDAAYWDKKWKGSYADAWAKEKKLLIVLAAFSFVIAFCLILVCFNVHYMSIKKYNLNLLAFLISALLLFCFAFGVVVHHQDIRWWNTEYSLLDDFLHLDKLAFVIFVLACVALVLLFINLIVSYIFNIKSYTVFAMLWVLLFAIVVCAVAVYARNLKQELEKNSWENGRTIMKQIHRDDLKDLCPYSKYINADNACVNEDITYVWESKTSAPSSLNYQCYGSVSRFIYWKYFIFFLLASFMMILCLYMAFSNYALAFNRESRKSNLLYLALLGLMLLVGLALAAYLIWGYKHKSHDTYNNFATQRDSKFKPAKRVSQSAVDIPTKCTPFSSNKPLELTGDQSDYGRLAILSQNSSINDLGKYDIGPSQRPVFFNDKNSANNFYLLVGTKQEINDQLKQASICPTDIHKSSDILFKYTKIAKADLSSKGLKQGETLSQFTLSENGTVSNPVNWSTDNTCNNSCSRLYGLSHANNVLFKVPLKVLTSTGINDSYSLKDKVNVNILDVNKKLLKSATVSANSTADFSLTPVSNLPMHVLVEVKDPQDYFKYNLSKREIPPAEEINGSEHTLSVLEVVPRDGGNCLAETTDNAFNTCAQSSSIKRGNLEVKTYNAMTQEMINEPVHISKYHVNEASAVGQYTSEAGVTTASGLPYGPYSVKVDSSDIESYEKSFNIVKGDQIVDVFLMPSDQNVERVSRIFDTTKINNHLNLKMTNSSGDECTVNMYNKKCPGSEMVTDYTKDQYHVQVIDINQRKDAVYSVFESPQQKLNTSKCGFSNEFVNKRTLKSYMNLKSHHYNTEPTTNKVLLVKCFSGYGSKSIKIVNKVMDSGDVMKVCKDLLDNSEYSLENLNKEVNA